MPFRVRHRKHPQDVTHLMNVSRVYEELCPELARFLMHEARAIEEKKSADGDATHGKDGGLVPVLYQCPHCCQRFRAGNHRVRLRPKRRPAARVHSVLRREARGKRLSLAQRELLRRFRSSTSKLMATCHTCGKTSRYNGVNRDVTMAFSRSRGGKLKSPPASVNHRSHPGTPKSAGKVKTPASETPGKTKTPASKTPRRLSSSTPGSGATASSSSSAKSAKSAGSVKKWVVRGLQKILNRDQKTDSKKGTLKDFLSSL